jgi:hypothetical protein
LVERPVRRRNIILKDVIFIFILAFFVGIVSIRIMIAYKLIKVRKDGSIGSLFMNAARKLPMGEWMEAEDHNRKGFAKRVGWHTLAAPSAPHLPFELASGEKRAMFEVEIEDYSTFHRPESQGGKWYLAKRMKILRRL